MTLEKVVNEYSKKLVNQFLLTLKRQLVKRNTQKKHSMEKLKIKIDTKGVMSFIYDDQLASLLQEGQAEIRRVSNVEPCKGGWQATMVDQIKLPVCRLRNEALELEMKYLEHRLFEDV